MHAPASSASPARRGSPFGPLLVLIGVGVGLNVVVGQIVRNVLRLPIYLDSIGTILAGAWAGPSPAPRPARCRNSVGAAVQRSGHHAVRADRRVHRRRGGRRRPAGPFPMPSGPALAGLVTGVMAALVSAPITAYVQQGARWRQRRPADVLLATSDNLLQAATLQGFVSDPLDKTSRSWPGCILLLLPQSVRERFADSRAPSRARGAVTRATGWPSS